MAWPPPCAAAVDAFRSTLHEIGAARRPELLALNKIDAAPPHWVLALQRAHPNAVPVSARTGEGVSRLRTEVQRALRVGAS